MEVTKSHTHMWEREKKHFQANGFKTDELQGNRIKTLLTGAPCGPIRPLSPGIPLGPLKRELK